jgi:hypothetical protein
MKHALLPFVGLTLVYVTSIGATAGPRAVLVEARGLAYDAFYRNDQSGLRAAIEAMQPLTSGPVRSHAHYYLSWAHGALSTSQFVAKDTKNAADSANRALEHARQALVGREADPEFQVALANALIGVMLLDRPRFASVYEELKRVRQKALELGPKNPRVILMDSGIIFNDPSETDGQQRGVARVEEALRLFEAESEERTLDPLAPRWGHAPAYAVLANFLGRLKPPQNDKARQAAESALSMRPDYWFVREQVLPSLK